MKEAGESQEKLKQIQLIEQNLQAILQQKQSYQAQLVETEAALRELEKSDDNYKIIGNLMVKADKDELSKELNEKKEILNLRIQAFEKQESQIRERFKKLQSEVMDSLDEKQGRK